MKSGTRALERFGWFGPVPSRLRMHQRKSHACRRRPGQLMEWLESRTLLSTLNIDASGNLTYLEATSPGSPNVLTVSTTGSGGNYTFNESLQTITLGSGAVTAGWTGSGTNTVTGPDASVHSIAITKAGGDTVNIQSVDALTNVDAGTGTTVINIGNSGSLAGIQAAIFAKSTGGAGSVNLDDSSDATGRTFTVSTTQITSDALANPIDFSGGGIMTVGIKGGAGDNTFNVNNFGSGNLLSYNIDGGTGSSTMNLNSTVANLNYSAPGQISANPSPILHYANLANIHITQPATAPVGTAVIATPTAGLAFTNVVVATFTDSDLGVTASNFAASIDWGDGTTNAGSVIAASVAGNFDVVGSHTYAAAGTYPVHVTLTALGSTNSIVVGGTTILVTSQGPVASTPNPIASTATLPTPPLTAEGTPISGYEGLPVGDFPVPVSPPLNTDVLVATFMDSGTVGPPTAYTASINWGDGSALTPATRITSTGTPSGTVFSVYGTHTYARFGFYPVITTITKPPGTGSNEPPPARRRSPRR